MSLALQGDGLRRGGRLGVADGRGVGATEGAGFGVAGDSLKGSRPV